MRGHGGEGVKAEKSGLEARVGREKEGVGRRTKQEERGRVDESGTNSQTDGKTEVQGGRSTWGERYAGKRMVRKR